jgi:hypothetical protein
MNRLVHETSEPSQLSPQAGTVLSLLRDVQAAESRISPDAGDAWYSVKALVEGDLAIAKREAERLPGAEGAMLAARASIQEARLYYRFSGTGSKDGLIALAGGFNYLKTMWSKK